MLELSILLFVLFCVHVTFRAINRAAHQSALEDRKRELVREILRQRRLDALYGRNKDD